MSRQKAVASASESLTDGSFLALLQRRVAVRTVSQDPQAHPQLRRYLEELDLDLRALGFSSEIIANPVAGGGPLMISHYRESATAPTLFCYAHADVVEGQDHLWGEGLAPWKVVPRGDRIYGRGTADNKGQHTILLLALESVFAARGGKLGYNVTLLTETSEEIGSPGLEEFCLQQAGKLRADLLISSDGPRLSPDQPTLILGTRGVFDFDLVCDLRKSGHHSGNWGGLIANPAVLLAHAVAALVARDGRINARGTVPARLELALRESLKTCRVRPGARGPTIDDWWGEPGLSPEERVFGWNALEVLAFDCGHPDAPVNAIPPRAKAQCQIRYTVDTDPACFLDDIRATLERAGVTRVAVVRREGQGCPPATRLDSAHPAVVWAIASVAQTLKVAPSIVPNAGGSLPNHCFSQGLQLPTIWIPHSYPGCQQHAPDEHLLVPLVDEGLRMMAGLLWDLGEPGAPWTAAGTKSINEGGTA